MRPRVFTRVSTLVLAAACVVASPSPPLLAAGEQQKEAASSSSHVYHLTAFRAAPGRLNDLLKILNTPQPGAREGDFAVVFRHRQGHEWDLLLVEHVGERATITATPPGGPAVPADSAVSQVTAWHVDTYAAGPPLEEFRKALSLQGGAGQKAVYVISAYTAAPGHRGQLRTQIGTMSDETPGRTVTLTHIEGAPWTFLHITRYDSWRQFAEEEEAQDAQAAKAPTGPGTGAAIREHITLHHDTLAVVAAVLTPKR
jgi:hypothetical protein